MIPWLLSDSNFVRCPTQRLDPSKTVFVGALHGVSIGKSLLKSNTYFQVSWLLRAWLKCLPTCLEASSTLGSTRTDSSDQAVMPWGYVHWNVRYPIGSGRVTFSNAKSYMKAVAAAFIEIKTVKFTKKVQVDPYLEDALCSCCFVRQGPYFCRWKPISLN